MYNDIVLLDDEENMNNGKTTIFYQWLAKRPGPRPHFAFKADDDVGHPMHHRPTDADATSVTRLSSSLTI